MLLREHATTALMAGRLSLTTKPSSLLLVMVWGIGLISLNRELLVDIIMLSGHSFEFTTLSYW